MMYPFIPLLRTPTGVREGLRHSMLKGEQLRLLKQWNDMGQQNRVKTFIGIIVLCIIMIFSFYFAMGFCSVYIESQNLFVIGWFITVLIDALVVEIVYELLIAAFYNCRTSSMFE
jgi:hypothetical protein